MASPAEVDAASATRAFKPGPAATRRRNWRPEPSAWTGLLLAAPLLVMLVAFVVYPFVRLVAMAIGAPHGLGNLSAFFANRANLRVVEVTFRDAAVVTLITFIGGTLMAWALRTSQSRILRFCLLAAIFVPFWMGSVVKIYAFSVLLGRAGLINAVLQWLHIVTQPLSLLYTQEAVVAGMVYQMIPYAVLPMFVAFSSIDLTLVGAAEGMGASRVRAIADVVLPLAAPGILATLILIFVIASGYYLTPVLLGGETQPFTASLIQQDLFTYLDIAGASIGGLMLVIGGAIAVVVCYVLVGGERLRRAISA